MATKDISEYAGITATVLKSKADFPDQGDMTVNGTIVECSDLSLMKLRSATGSILYGIGGIFNDSPINQWSFFGAYRWDLLFGVWDVDVHSPYPLGNFACYNHNAIAPNIVANSTSLDVYEDSTSDQTIFATVDLGEIDWMAREAATALGVITRLNIKVSRYDDSGKGTLEGEYYGSLEITESEYPLGYLYDTLYVAATIPYEDIDRWSYFETEVYFASESDSGNAKVCDVPNLSLFATTVNYIEESVANYCDLSNETKGDHPTWVLLINSYSIDVGVPDLGDETWFISIHGLDTNSNGIGDVNMIFEKLSIYARKNATGLWYYCGGDFQPSGDQTEFDSGDLPFDVESYGDTVAFKLFEYGSLDTPPASRSDT